MRQWLIYKIAMFIQKLTCMRKKNPDEEQPEEIEETPPCPICGMEWYKNDPFCANCGYEPKDESLPLHPPPARTGEITDPDGFLSADFLYKWRVELADIARTKGYDIALFVLPESLNKKMIFLDGRRESLAGFAYNLFNTWRIGYASGYKGILLVIDPFSSESALVTGRNGPRISGKDFREWNHGMKNAPKGVQETISHTLEKITSI